MLKSVGEVKAFNLFTKRYTVIPCIDLVNEKQKSVWYKRVVYSIYANLITHCLLTVY